MTQASFPPGQTTLRFYTFVSDVDIEVPRAVGVSCHAAGFVVDSDLLGREYDGFLTPVEAVSEDYASAESRLRIELIGFVANLKVRRF